MTQAQALDILKTGANVFLTGEPGAGKTYTINRYIEYLRERGIEPAITASTGIAATHVGGMTIHAWSGIGIKAWLSEWDLEAMLEREPLVRRVRSTHVLIIDEVSMLSSRTLTMVDKALRVLRGTEEPFGGMQVVFVGDFFQLPPVSRAGEEEERFSYESPSWQEANPLICYLSEQHRQSDDVFLELLGALRRGAVTAAHKQVLKGRATRTQSEATELYPHNADVDRVNEEALFKIDALSRAYTMTSEGNRTLIEALKKGCLSPETLVLKEGARVMFTRNNFDKGYVNGTLGEIVGYSVGGFPLVRTRNGMEIEASPEEWSIDDQSRTLAKIAQVPLRLAWAITVHKSQGMSLDAAVMDLGRAFEFGQGYVALSRVRSLEGLHLTGFNERALQVHPDVLERDDQFRGASDAAADAFAAMPPQELKDLHAQFVTRIGGKEPEAVKKERAASKKEGNRLEKLRAKHKNAYRPWSKEDDAKLTEMFRDNASVSTLVKEFGRQKGAISSRLMRLGLVEPDM